MCRTYFGFCIHYSMFTTKSLLLLLLLSHFSRVQLCATPQTAAHQASPFWDSPGKNTGVGCHFLLQCMKVKSESDVAQSCPPLHDSMNCNLTCSSVHGIFQARVLEWVAIAFFDQKLSLHQSTYCYLTIFINSTLPLAFFTSGNCYSVFCIYVFNFIWFSLSTYFFIPYMNEITHYLAFSISLISLQIMPSQSIHIVTNSRISSF